MAPALFICRLFHSMGNLPLIADHRPPRGTNIVGPLAKADYPYYAYVHPYERNSGTL